MYKQRKLIDMLPQQNESMHLLNDNIIELKNIIKYIYTCMYVFLYKIVIISICIQPNCRRMRYCTVITLNCTVVTLC